MSFGLLIFVFALVGFILAFNLPRPMARKIFVAYGAGALLSFTGCAGALSWLAGETSGNAGILTGINPYFWYIVFCAGAVVLFINTIVVFVMRAGAGAKAE